MGTLAHGSDIGRRDYSRDDMSWAMRLANRGSGVEAITSTLSRKPSGRRPWYSVKYARLYEERGKEVADRYARRTAEKAVERVRRFPAIRDPHEAIVRLLDIETAALMHRWGGGMGSSARRAFFGALTVANRLPSVTFGLAWREWSELVGTPHRRVRHVVTTALDGRWVTRNPDDRMGRTSRWALRVPRDCTFNLTPGDMNVQTRPTFRRDALDPIPPTRLLNHDAFVALGDDAWHVFDVSFTQGRVTTPRTLELATGMDAPTLAATIDLLLRERVIREEGPLLVGPRDVGLVLDDTAFRLGSLLSLDRLKATHKSDREAFRRGDVNVQRKEDR